MGRASRSRLMWVAMASAVAVVAGSQSASAQEARSDAFLREHVKAPKYAFELAPGVSYAAPIGDVERGNDVRDFAGSGVSPTLGIAYRLDPRIALGITGAYQEFRAGNDPNDGAHVRGRARSFAVGPDVTLHFRPFHRIDPFFRGGGGYRAMWEVRDGIRNDVTYHGFEFARAAFGVDMRVSRDVAIAPVIGGNANVFLWRVPQGASGTAIDDPRVSVQLQAGLEGRFDLGGQRIYRPDGTARYVVPTGVTTTTSVVTAPAPCPCPTTTTYAPVGPAAAPVSSPMTDPHPPYVPPPTTDDTQTTPPIEPMEPIDRPTRGTPPLTPRP